MTDFDFSQASWDGNVFPASPAQERVWFLEHLQPGTAIHHIPWLVRLDGVVDGEQLRNALAKVVARHEALRTRFVSRAGALVQVVDSHSSVELTIEKLPADAGRDPNDYVRTRLEREAAELFDLGEGPLIRAVLLVVSSTESMLMLTLHHIIADGWSLAIIARELAAFYRRSEASLSDVKWRSADCVQWQRKLLSDDRLHASLDYWREQLRGVEPLALPTDHRRQPALSAYGGLIPFRLPMEQSQQIERFARGERKTVFVTLLAAFQVLLARYTGQMDVPVGSPVANRSRVELENVVGLFVNTVVFRGDLSGDPSFRELLGRVQALVLDGHEHSAVPFERLVEELQPERLLGQTPLFQVMFAWQGISSFDFSLPGIVATREALSTGASKFDLTLELAQDGDGFFGQLEYRRDLYEAGRMEGLLRHYGKVLEEVVGEPGERISRVRLMGAEERAELVGEWRGGGAAGGGAGEGLVGEFRRVAEAHGERVAVECGEERMTYAELEASSNRLARYLRGLGVGPEECVGLCVEPSCDLVVAMVGILKAGGAYLPLDPALPAARLAYMVRDAGAKRVVVGAGAGEGKSWGEAEVMALGEVGWREASASALEGVIEEEQLAYVIYTSGSTGQPKGVGVTHRNVRRLFAVSEGWGGFGAEDVWTLYHSYGFDFSVWEIWGALLYGGKLVVVPYWVARTPAEFYELLRAKRVTVLNQTPSAFRQLRGAEGRWSELAVRLVMLGGEALRYEELASWGLGEGRGVRLVNLYGITETTVHVTRCEVGEAELSGRRGPVIGGPLADVRMYVLDERLEPVPVGVAGELYVGGGGVARGYVGRPGLTAERFVPDPYGLTGGARLYRTGDVVRYLGGGEYAYLGRADRQVKIRGHRIELGEVEAALLAVPGVREAVVESRADEGGWDRLVAYLVGEPQAAETLHAALAARLPVSMLPAAYEWLPRLPLTAQGKVDGRALPAPGERGAALSRSYEAPRTADEGALAAIWEQVLGVAQVGIQDNFFSLGGDSIRSLQVQALAAQRSLHFSLEQLFRHPTIAALSAELSGPEERMEVPHTEPFGLISAEERALLPPDVDDAYPLTQLQAGMLYHIALAPHSNIYHNTGGRHIRIRLPFDADVFRAAVRILVANHPVFRTSFDLYSYHEPLQLVHREATLPVDIMDLRHLTSEAQDAVLLDLLDTERTRRFDLSQPTLLRFFIHLRSENTFQFSITECHAIYDGWSYHSAIVELFNTYAAILQGQPVRPREPLSVTFRDFVALERQVISSPSARTYWKNDLKGCTACTLPRFRPITSKRPQPLIRSFHVTIPERVSSNVQKLARTHGLPLKSLLLAAHLKAIRVVCDTTDVLTGLVANGRPHTVDSDRLFGLFLNTVPFRLILRRGTWLELVRATYAHECELLPHRRLPLTLIQNICDRPHLCDEILFNYMDFHVYEELDPALGFEVLGGNNAEGSNIALTAHFQRRTLISLLDKTRIHLQLDYDVNQIDEAQIAEIGLIYSGALQHMSGSFLEPHDRCSSPALTRPAGLTFGEQPSSDPGGENFLARLKAAVTRFPNAVAAAHDARHLTYAELDGESNRLAHALRARGIVPECRVGICLQPSVELLISLLAVWKAGAAYVPLDPMYPPDRLACMRSEARLQLVLTSQELQTVHSTRDCDVFCLDRDRHEWLEHPASSVDVAVLPEHLAYVIYTSGSTGRPKGCGVARGGFENLLAWYCRSLGAGPVRALILSSFGFDLTQKNLFAPLALGGTVHFCGTPYFDNRAIGEQIAREQITLLNCTPSAFYPLLEAAQGDEYRPLGSLQHVVLGGEPIAPERLGRWRASAFCQARVMNSYGPTECSDVSASHWLDSQLDDSSRPVPIGRPIAGARIVLVDEHLEPVPAGVTGELCITGIPVGRGYVNDPGMTAERFVPNPFSPTGGERLYRTGDQARYNDGNVLELAGRIDRQIKVRGFRIEPGELESVLEQHENVAWVHVALSSPPGTPESAQLAAYLLLKEMRNDYATDLRNYLAARVPEYMIPTLFIPLERLPLTPNRKLDHAALAAIRPEIEASASTFMAPQQGMEQLVAEQWCTVLGISQVGRQQNFFEVGGDSLRLLQVHGRLEHKLHQRIPLVDLFNHPTIAALAQCMEGCGARSEPSGLRLHTDDRPTPHVRARKRRRRGSDRP